MAGFCKEHQNLYAGGYCFMCANQDAARPLSQPTGDFTGLLSAAKTGAKWMRWWLNQAECECEYGHSCGKPERERELAQMEAAISAAEGR